mgnify:CR=1 FL=1
MSKIARKITYHLYRDCVHEQTHISSLYKFNVVTGARNLDPYQGCKSLGDVKNQILISDRKNLSHFFKEGYDFVLAKIDKRGLCTFQQIFPNDLVNSIRFLKEIDKE